MCRVDPLRWMIVRSESSFESAFDGLFELAYRVALRLHRSPAAAEDIAAETLTRAYVRWKSIGDRDWLEAWVVRVATNVALDVHRRERRDPRLVERPSPSEDHDHDVSVVAALAGLSRRQRQVVALRYLADFSESQVADALGLSLGSVRTHLRRGLNALRVTLPTSEVFDA